MAVTKKDLSNDLLAMGLKPGDTLLVHSSMKSIGPVEGGPDAVLDGLSEFLRPGLLVFPTLSYESVDAGHPLFSVRDTPSCVGLLTELFRKRPEAVRSWHPTHSVAASGDDAARFAAGHELDETPCCRKGPWGRLLDRKARILFVGTGISCNTFLHGVEEWNKVPDYFTKKPEMLKITTPGGRIIERGYYRHDQHNSNNYAKLEPLFIEKGAMTAGKFGAAECRLGDCVLMESIVTDLLKSDIRFFFHDRMPAS